ncbi:zinc ABC transporter substrate-binding protein [Granulicatella sp. zg-ZJ]|uniref:metal ABC transporter solute-binding protein, Zn/Mn family n=1 Tax=Granulicatella sp. zg-ZJ TaxID=2678504 RepID=UPI0013D70F55|nr:zinc ABC transporter substrate-binding protein [Granulicatella sp. zg-ZJ]NEW63376.1 zinc ABC transporter substrate-binding protein [Granulicatella sp. zg-ZJ]
MKHLKKLSFFILVLVLAACQAPSKKQEMTEAPKMEKLSVVTSFYPVYYMTQAIAGEHANVSMLIEGAVEPHDFEPSAKDIALIDKAKVFVYSSNNMETWVKSVQDGLGKESKVAFIESGKDVSFIKGKGHHHDHDGDHKDDHDEDEDVLDPHIWLDPETAKAQVKTIAEGLIAADAAHKADYEKNRDMLLEKLDVLAKKYDAAFKNATNKAFVTQHAAFGYIAHRYDLEQEAISGLQAKEPTAQDIAEVVEEMKEHKLTTIYVDPGSSQATANAVAKETGASIETLYTMESKVEGKDFLQILEENLVSLQKSIK